MKKLIAILFSFFMAFNAYADEVDPIFGINPDNPLNLHPPVWVHGFWEDDIGYDHMQISPDGIVADFILYRPNDGGTELTLSLLDKLFYSQNIYELELDKYDMDKHVFIYDAKLITSIERAWNSLYAFWWEDPFKFSSDYVLPLSYELLENLGIAKEDKAADVKTKIQNTIDTCNSFISEFRDNTEYALTIERMEQDIVFLEKLLKMIDEENYDFDSFLISMTLSLPTVLQLNEYLSKCSVEEMASYPYYGVRFLYDDVEFASLDFSRSEDELDVTMNVYCFNEYMDPVPAIIEGITSDELEEYGLTEKFEFEFREYSMNRKSIR